jgi:threonylcarbamoyladenosine tRNA methylthiotransferase MtaB
MRIYLDTVGCRLNQSEIEAYARQFHAAGHELVAEPERADLAVVNTCAVTRAAAADSRKAVRSAQRQGAGEVVVTGCWSTLNPGAAARLGGVERVVPNEGKENLVPEVLGLSPETFAEVFDLEPVARQMVPGSRLRTRAFIKVQDGCDNRCTFCVTTVARGPGRSRPLEDVLGDVRAALLGEAREIVLTGVHLGSWGQDLERPQHLRDLVGVVLQRSEVPRLRLSSLEPWDLDESFFELWDDERLCRHLHLPLQSGSAATLRRMARKTTPASFAALVRAARSIVADMAITTDVITGFPGETQAEFEESLDFVRAMNFAGGHVFTYSARPGTAAAGMPDQVPHPLRKKRNARMRAALAGSLRRYQERFLGRVLPVLWESATALGPDGWRLSGLTDNYLRVRAGAPQHIWNQITPVRLLDAGPDGLDGELIPLGGD